MNKRIALAMGFALVVPAVYAQDSVDNQADNSFASEAPDANSFGSDANSFGDDANSFGSDANSFGDDANSFGSDANSFGGDAGESASDANSFGGDSNSFGSEADTSSSDANSFGGDSNSFGGSSFGGSDDYSPFGSDEEEQGRSPIPLYVGVDYAWTTASFSNESLKAKFGGEKLDSQMIRVRGGVRLFDKIGFELHYGMGQDDADEVAADEFATASYYGVYLVPTGILLDTIEVGAAIGYASTELEQGSVSETIDGASFGVNFELPVWSSETLGLRIGGGGTVYRAQNSARIYGYHAGVRLDFKI